MKNIWFTSDTHFWHDNIRHFCGRPYSSVQEMNEGLIENWNSVVRPKDEIYHLGDFSMQCDTQSIVTILKQLNGRKYFIRGNHDQMVKDEALKYFEWDKDMYNLKSHKLKLVLCHFPLETWVGAYRPKGGTYHLHGHTHKDLPTSANIRRMDVGVDSNNMFPVSLEQVFEKLKNRGPTGL